MSALLLDDDSKVKLDDLNQRVEIRDASGRRVGCFIPDGEYMQLTCLPDHIVEEPKRLNDATTSRE